MGKSTKSLLIFSIVAWLGAALPFFVYGDTSVPHQIPTITFHSTDGSVETLGFAAQNEHELEVALDYLQSDYEKTASSSETIQSQVLFLSEADSTHSAELKSRVQKKLPTSIVSRVLPKALSKKIQDIKERFQSLDDRSYRVSFALVRGVLNGGVTAWGLTISPDQSVPFLMALPVGLGTGLISGSVQYWNKPFVQFLSNAKSWPGMLGRWLGIEYSFLAIVRGMMEGAGIQTEASFSNVGQTLLSWMGLVPQNTIGYVGLSLAETSLLGVGGQGLWDALIAKQDKEEKATRPESEQGWVQFKTDLKSLGISVASVGAAVSAMSGAGNTAIYMLGATGIVATVVSYSQDGKLKKFYNRIRSIFKKNTTSRCSAILESFQTAESI